jgi:L-ascorbate metabolism protein UlaG (beta-lactamase superfamily)
MTNIALLGHSAVSLQKADTQVIIDPGVLSDLTKLKQAQSVLITHGHADHIAPGIAENADLQIWGSEDVITQLSASGVSSAQLHAVGPGDTFQTAGFQIAVLGGQHATIHPDLPPVSNNAYLIDHQILHPGDSFTDASHQAKIIHLFVPVTAAWMRLADAVD